MIMIEKKKVVENCICAMIISRYFINICEKCIGRIVIEVYVGPDIKHKPYRTVINAISRESKSLNREHTKRLAGKKMKYHHNNKTNVNCAKALYLEWGMPPNSYYVIKVFNFNSRVFNTRKGTHQRDHSTTHILVETTVYASNKQQ